MNKNIENVVTEQEVVGVANHSRLRKCAIVVAVTGAIGVVGYLTTKYVIKPIAKKIKAKKLKKHEAEVPASHQTSIFDEDDDVPEMPFPDEEKN